MRKLNVSMMVTRARKMKLLISRHVVIETTYGVCLQRCIIQFMPFELYQNTLGRFETKEGLFTKESGKLSHLGVVSYFFASVCCSICCYLQYLTSTQKLKIRGGSLTASLNHCPL